MTLGVLGLSFCAVRFNPSGVVAIDDAQMLALLPAAQGIILPQRVGGKILPRQNPPEVRMIPETNAEHVVGFALGAIRPRARCR